MRISKTYLLFGFVVGVVLWAVFFTSLNSQHAIRVTSVSLDDYVSNSNTAYTGNSLAGFNSSENSTVIQSFVVTAPAFNETLTSFKINTPGFSLQNVSPSLPKKISANRNATFTLAIKTPASKYVGALSITEVYSLEIPTVNVTEVRLVGHETNNNATLKIGSYFGFNSLTNSIVKDTFIITANPYNETINSYQLNTSGFSLVNVTPTLPVKIIANQTKSFTLNIKTPDTPYTGPVSVIESYTWEIPANVIVTAVNTHYSQTIGSGITFTGGTLPGFNTTAGAIGYETFITNNKSPYNETFYKFQLNTTGFALLNVSPKLPVTISPGTNESFTLKIRSPPYQYVGPLSVIGYYK